MAHTSILYSHIHREPENVSSSDSDPDSVIVGCSDNQVNFLMDLFHQSQVMDPTTHLVDSDFGDDHSEPGFDFDLGLRFGLDNNCGFQNSNRQDFNNNNNNNNNNNDSVVIDDDDFFVERRRLSALQSCDTESTVSLRSNAIRAVESDSDNNTLAVDVNSMDEYGLDRDNMRNYTNHFDDGGDEGDDDVSVTIPLCWDSLQLEDHRENNEDFEWEEVDDRVDEREILSVFVDDEDAASVSLSILPIIATDDMLSVERVGGIANLEWEVLLNANNLESNPDRDHDDHNTEPYFGDHDDYIYTAEYEMLFGQFAENETSFIGQPPAAKSIVDRLPSVVVLKEDAESNNALCAVCKDEMKVGERAKKLPCTHQYHGECILPWLGIRNTCPVCRYELPTDDADYERRRAVQRVTAAVRHL